MREIVVVTMPPKTCEGCGAASGHQHRTDCLRPGPGPGLPPDPDAVFGALVATVEAPEAR